MNYKNILAVAAALTVASVTAGCADEYSPEVNITLTPQSADVPVEELEPPVPVEASDPNTITFDDDDISFASVQDADVDSAKGSLSVEAVQGNKMLKFTDSGSNYADGTVQKVKFDAARLLSPENLEKVRSIEMDVYADATAQELLTEAGEYVVAPGWIGGGAGANVAGDKWYEFGEWQGGEYNFDMSGAVHIQLKFLLAAGGRCWSGEMEEATLQIMRWGAQNEGNFYIDNIVFYDGDGVSLPIEKSEKAVPEDGGEPEETSETAEESSESASE